MTWLVLSMFLNTSYHQNYNYEPKEYELVRQLSLLAIEKLGYSGCDNISNYYATSEYFAFETLCPINYGLHQTKIRKITIIDIEWMTFERFNEAQF